MRRLALLLLVLMVLAAGAWLAARALLASDLVRSTLEAQMTERLGQPVRIGAATAAVFPRIALDLHDVTIGDPPAARLGTVRVVAGLRGLISRRIEDAEVIVSRSRLELPLVLGLIAGARPASAAEPETRSGFTVVSVRVIALRDVTLVAEGQEVRVDLQSALDADRLDISSLTIRAPVTALEASGALTSMERIEGQFEARADPLDVAEMLAIGTALSRPAAPRAAASQDAAISMRIGLTLHAPRGVFSSYEFSDLSLAATLLPERITLKPLSLKAFGGSASGALDVATGGRVPQLRLNGQLDGVDVAALMQHEGGPAGITGRLGGRVSLAAAGTAADALLTSARGTIDAAITDGAIPGMDMVRTIVLAFGRPAGAPPEGTGSEFSRLGGRFALANGVLSSDNLAMTSRDFDLAGRTTLNLVTRAVDARVDVVLSKELTAQAGTDLQRYAGEDGRVVVPGTITGSLDRPVVSLNVAAAAKRAIEGELRRRTRSLIDDLFRRRNDR